MDNSTCTNTAQPQKINLATLQKMINTITKDVTFIAMDYQLLVGCILPKNTIIVSSDLATKWIEAGIISDVNQNKETQNGCSQD